MTTETTTPQLYICENGECNHLHYFHERVETPIMDGKKQLECPVCEHSVYMECDHWLEWGQIHEKWSKSITLYYVESSTTTNDKNGNDIIESINMSFGFYDCEYQVSVSKKDVYEDINSVAVYGDSELYDSFNALLEDEFWEKLKLTFKLFEKYYFEDGQDIEKLVEGGNNAN